jgi:hypothetical protein
MLAARGLRSARLSVMTHTVVDDSGGSATEWRAGMERALSEDEKRGA